MDTTNIIPAPSDSSKNVETASRTDADELDKQRRERYSTVDVGNPDKPDLHVRLRLAAELVAEEKENLFIHGSKLVEIDADEIVPVDGPYKVKSWYLENVRCYKRVKSKNGGSKRAYGQAVPGDDCAVLASRVSPWRPHLAELKSVNSVPFLIPDGLVPSVATKRGFYPTIGLYNVIETGAPEMTGRYSQAAARESLEWIRSEMFGDFHFVSAADEANAIAAPLMLLTRYLHPQVLPLVIITAPESGTGKGLLSRATATIVSPKPSETMSLPTSDDEMSKTLGSVLNRSQPVIRFDNAPRGNRIDSPVLCQFLTSADFSTRKLRTSEILSGFNDRLTIVDGNGIGPADDMVRRTIVIQMDAGAEHPTLDGKRIYRHEDLVFWINERREEVLFHYLRLALAWFQAGRPEPLHAQKNDGFQDVINVVSGILEYAGERHFWANMERVRLDAVDGSEKEVGFNFCRWLYQSLPNSNRFASADVVAKVHEVEGESRFMVTTTPLPVEVHDRWDSGPAAKSIALTNWFKGARGQRFTVGDETYRVEMLDSKVGNKTQFSVLLDVRGDSADLEEFLEVGL